MSYRISHSYGSFNFLLFRSSKFSPELAGLAGLPGTLERCLRTQFGNTVWEHSLATSFGTVFGNIAWEHSLGTWFGNIAWGIVWDHSLGTLFGNVVWQHCLGHCLGS